MAFSLRSTRRPDRATSLSTVLGRRFAPDQAPVTLESMESKARWTPRPAAGTSAHTGLQAMRPSTLAAEKLKSNRQLPAECGRALDQATSNCAALKAVCGQKQEAVTSPLMANLPATGALAPFPEILI